LQDDTVGIRARDIDNRFDLGGLGQVLKNLSPAAEPGER
jgi:hypothetical protein